MKPAWDELMVEYTDHPSILIGDVDCTAEDSKALCETHGVEGFPTIKHGDPNSLEAFEGGRDLESLQTFVKENMGPTCGPANLDLCDEEKKKKVNSLMAMPFDELVSNVTSAEELITKLEADFKELLTGLQSDYESAETEKTRETAKIKDSGLATWKQVLAKRMAAEGKLEM